MKKLFFAFVILAWAIATISAQNSNGIMGFANVNDLGLSGVTGGMDGRIVHVKTHDDLVKYCKANEPLTVIIDNSISGHWVKGLNGAPSILDEISVTSNKTIMAAGPEVKLDSMCFDIKNQQNIIFRNITLTAGKPDGIAFRTSHHIWIDHCDLSTCDDGLMDFTLGSSYGTISWSAFHDHDKVSLACSGTMHYEDYDRERVTYHHNHYYNGTQRNPRIGYGLGHLWNNYWNNNTYEGSSGYCVGYFNGAKVLVENGYFENVKEPFQNMYGVYDYDSSWADLESRGNLFGSGVSGNKTGTGKSFSPTRYYEYDFDMQPAEYTRDEMLQNVGPQKWVVNDIYGFPGNGAIDIQSGTTLKWSEVEGATAYHLFFGESVESMTEVYSGAERMYSLAGTTLMPSNTYYWQVLAEKGGEKFTSSVFRFRTALDSPVAQMPIDGAEDYQVYYAYTHGVQMEGKGCVATEAGYLEWTPTLNAKSYNIYVDDELIGESDTYKFIPNEPLRLGKQYTWRVDAINNDGSITTGDTWTFSSPEFLIKEGKTECEDMLRYGLTFLELENGKVNWGYKASGDWVTTGEAGTGTLAGIYDGRDGICKVDFCYFDEKQGQGIYQLRVNNKKVGSFVANKNTNKLATQSFSNIELHKGDQLTCDFLMQDKMKCRFDYINITVVEELAGIRSLTPALSQEEGAIYNLAGQKVSADYKGIVIKNGKKILLKN